MRLITLAVFWVGLSFGLLNMLLGMAVAFGVVQWRSELPWFDVQGVKCHMDEVYVGLGYFSTVLVYDTMGHHVRSIPVATRAKPFSFSVDHNGVVNTRHTYAARTNAQGFQLYTRRMERTLNFKCIGHENGELRQSAWVLIFAGPLPGGLVCFMSILGILALSPNALTKLFERATNK